jgi:hypothetical protein
MLTPSRKRPPSEREEGRHAKSAVTTGGSRRKYASAWIHDHRQPDQRAHVVKGEQRSWLHRASKEEPEPATEQAMVTATRGTARTRSGRRGGPLRTNGMDRTT